MNETGTSLMPIEPRHVAALDKAEQLIFHSDFCPYLELKAMLSDPSPETNARFRILFTRFYGFNAGGLTEEFKSKFFEIMHGEKVLVNGKPDFLGILSQLSGIRRKKGDFAMPFSLYI